MRDKQTSLAEKKFLLQALAKRIRLDERKLGQQRKINIQCSENIPGTCLVSLGQSKVLIQTNFKVEEPREIRPIEGRHWGMGGGRGSDESFPVLMSHFRFR